MLQRVWLVYLSINLLVLSGCHGKDEVKSVDVKGVVTLDGKPMPDGDIRFILSGQAPSICPVQNGSYSGKAYVGENRVEIRSYRSPPRSTLTLPSDDPNAKVNFLPNRYNGLSTLKATVKAEGANEFEFKVTSR